MSVWILLHIFSNSSKVSLSNRKIVQASIFILCKNLNEVQLFVEYKFIAYKVVTGIHIKMSKEKKRQREWRNTPSIKKVYFTNTVNRSRDADGTFPALTLITRVSARLPSLSVRLQGRTFVKRTAPFRVTQDYQSVFSARYWQPLFVHDWRHTQRFRSDPTYSKSFKNFPIIYYYCCLQVCACVMSAWVSTAHMWWSENDFV